MTKRHIPKPLREFNYQLVAEKMDGLLINIDRDLQRLGNRALQRQQADFERCILLLNVFIRFARNSYDAVRYVAGMADTTPVPAGTVDAGSAPDIVTAMSSVQRIADPQVPPADTTTLASDNAAFAFAAYQQLITANTNLVFYQPASPSPLP